MNKDLNVLVICVVVSGIGIVKSIQTHKTEKAKRQEIEAQLQKDLAAVHRAGKRAMDRLNNEPIPTSLVQMMIDFEFEMIVAFNE